MGDRLKDTYRRVASASGPSEDEVKAAFSTLIGAWDQVATSLSTALNDPDTRAHLKQAASSFAAALGATVTGLGDEMSGGSVTADQSGGETVDQGSGRGDIVDSESDAPPAPA